jgi:hypothetical protein
LVEAMRNRQTLKSETETIKTGKTIGKGKWEQYLTISRVGETIYLDQGNGRFER